MRAVVVALLVAGSATAAAPEYELKTGGAVEVATGARGSASLTIAPAAGRRIDGAAPLSVRLSAPKGLKLERRRLSLADAADPRAEAPRFDLAFTAEQPGAYALTVEARFWICAKKTCRPVRDKVEIAVTVADPSP
jgi:hypothetical protein